MATDTEPAALRDPANIQEAKDRILALSDKIRQLQIAIQGPKGVIDGRRVSSTVFADWQQARIREQGVFTSERIALKRWIARKYREQSQMVRETLDADSIGAVMKAAREANINLLRLVQGLRDTVTQLQRENAALRETLRKNQPEQSVAPGEGVDEWRDTNR